MKQRIGYIDSAKGVCILLIVAMHLGIPECFPGAYQVMVPVFFLVSGYFYSTKMGFKPLVMKKTRQLLIPFLFFYLLSYSFYYISKIAYPPVNQLYSGGLLDCFVQKQYFNGPLWFLPCLFSINIIVYPIYKFLRDKLILRILCFFSIGILGYYLSIYEIFLPLAVDTALTAVPFFCMGKEFAGLNLFEKVSFKLSPVVMVASYLPYLLFPAGVWMACNIYYTSNFIHLYIVFIPFTIFIVLACKLLERYKVSLKFFGQISLVILCTHHLIYRPIRIILLRFLSQDVEPYINFILTIICCYLLSVVLSNKRLSWIIGK